MPPRRRNAHLQRAHALRPQRPEAAAQRMNQRNSLSTLDYPLSTKVNAKRLPFSSDELHAAPVRKNLLHNAPARQLLSPDDLHDAPACNAPSSDELHQDRQTAPRLPLNQRQRRRARSFVIFEDLPPSEAVDELYSATLGCRTPIVQDDVLALPSPLNATPRTQRRSEVRRQAAADAIAEGSPQHRRSLSLRPSAREGNDTYRSIQTSKSSSPTVMRKTRL
jgi:hypothetical protein